MYKMAGSGIWKSVKRGVVQLVRRPIYLVSMILIPIGTALFLLDLMKEGLPEKVPAAIVDLDHTDMSRGISQTLGSMQMVDIKYKLNSYTEAREAIQRGEIFGFFVIPHEFSAKALAGRQPEISFYTNLTYYVPGSLLYKEFKTMSVLTSGALVKTVMTDAGIPEYKIMPSLQPISLHTHPLGNPWLSYAIYLGNSFIPATLALMIMLVTVFSIATEIKYNTSRDWLKQADGSILVALVGKLIPQAIIFSIVGIFIQALMYGYYHFPMNGNLLNMFSAMILMVIACQAFALFIVSIVPNLRLALSICSLVGVLSFSIAGFSFPVSSMYGSIGIFSYLLPIRYYFLIYIDQALNGISIYYSRFYYAALLVFPLVAMTMLWKLKKACQNPVYIP